MLRIHFLYEHVGDLRLHACSYIRVLLPLTHSVNAAAFQLSWGVHYEPADIVIVERYWKPVAPWTTESLVSRIREDGACLIYVIDDNLLDLTADPLGRQWSPATNDLMTVQYFAREADGIIVSTPLLKERLSALNDRIYVVPNALDERLLAKRTPAATASASGRKVIGYMGTVTHDTDLAVMSDALCKVLTRHRDTWEFQLVGGCSGAAFLKSLEGLPVSVLEVGNDSRYPLFTQWLNENIHWNLAIAPLADNAFTRCKSDMKFLDYSALGVAGIYSRVPAYESSVRHLETGYLVENHADAWETALEQLLTDDALRLTLARNAEEHVRSQRTLEHCAQHWHDAITAIVNERVATPSSQISPDASGDASVTVSIIILNYNGLSHLEPCLTSLARIAYPSAQLEIIIVDNASTDGSADHIARQYPHVRLIRSATNLGFSQGANLGAKAASGKYLAFLNNDMRVPPNWLNELMKAALAEERLACVGSAILNWEGTANDFVGRPGDTFCLATDPQVLHGYAIPDSTRLFLFVSAGAVLVQAKVFRECGGFDPDYFMYYEDVDLCWRMWLRGYQCAMAPNSVTYHRGRASSSKLPASYLEGWSQKHALFTLFKCLEAETLKELLPLVFYFLLERGRWNKPAQTSLAEAIEGFLASLERLLAKRAEIQQTRVINDAELFSQLGHPFAFLFKAEHYQTIRDQLATRCSKAVADLDSNSPGAIKVAISQWLNAAHFLVEHHWITEIHAQENERASLLHRQGQLNEAFARYAEHERALTEQVESLSEQLAAKDQQLVVKDQQLVVKDQQLVVKDQQLVVKDQQLQILTAELDGIKGSRGWRLLGYYWDVRLRYLFPVYRWLGFHSRNLTSADKPE